VAIPPSSVNVVRYLLGRGRLERIDGPSASSGADLVLARAAKRLATAQGGLAASDADGAFAASFDAYRMAAESLVVRQGLRSTGGDGSHVTIEDVVGAQFAADIEVFAKPTFERFRRMRHAAQYFDPSAAEIDVADAAWALETATRAVDGTARLSASSPPPLFPLEEA
jgi:hypothetical protein